MADYYSNDISRKKRRRGGTRFSTKDLVKLLLDATMTVLMVVLLFFTITAIYNIHSALTNDCAIGRYIYCNVAYGMFSNRILIDGYHKPKCKSRNNRKCAHKLFIVK